MLQAQWESPRRFSKQPLTPIELKVWIAERPINWGKAIAVRLALRMLPLVEPVSDYLLAEKCLFLFRSNCLAWAERSFSRLGKSERLALANRALEASQAVAESADMMALNMMAANADEAAIAASKAAAIAYDYNVPSIAESTAESIREADLQMQDDLGFCSLMMDVRYERRIRGERAAFDIPGDKRRVEDKKILRRIAEATDEDFWGKGHEYVNVKLKTWLDEARARVAPPLPSAHTAAQIADILQNQASPQAQIVDGKLDAVPNTLFDKPQYSDNLAELPSELIAFTGVIINSLPRNCEPVVRNCFGGFRDEMLVRGNRPILNIIKAMAASLTAELYGAPDETLSPDEWQLKDPREWGLGMDSLFASFFKGYHDLIHHFPMDVEREKLIAETPIDELAASGAALTEPVDAVAAMIVDLGKQGFATDNIVRIIEAHQLYNRDVSQLPKSISGQGAVTPKRRHVLTTAGFYLNTYNLLGSTASIAPFAAKAFDALVPKLKDAIDALLAFIR